MNRFITRVYRLLRVFSLTRQERKLKRLARRSGLFDANYYVGAYPNIHPVFHRIPLRHFIVYGETLGFRPNPDFSPTAYLRYNEDVAKKGVSPFLHWLTIGKAEGRLHKELPEVVDLPTTSAPVLQINETRSRARFALAIHVYYQDLWPEFEDMLARLAIPYDLFVTLTYRGEETEALSAEIQGKFPNATVATLPNRGRDLLPFVTLVNSGAFDGYDAVCKIHTKKSPHREDGDVWRRHLINGILPEQGLPQLLDRFLARRDAAFWVADGQHYDDTKWWGSNLEPTRALLRRIEIEITGDRLSFPAGSIYWIKPLMLGLLKGLNLREGAFEPESNQVDGTLAHALERGMGFLADAAGQRIVQTTELDTAPAPDADAPRPTYTSAFYLPQFHPIPENDAWWGKGFTEWRGTVAAKPLFKGHLQPLLPSDLGYYDLRVTEVMQEQTNLAREAGIDAFCVYHYWFDGRRVLETPLDRLLTQPEVDFPFYLCWANESWRRNWDGLSGTVLLEQTYATGFEEALVESTLPYMQDPRYQRPDGTRPRFVIYRPEDMPDPSASIPRLRAAWRSAGIGDVELGAVCFHISGESPVEKDLFDFWIEMPPHGLVTADDYLFGGPDGNRLGREVQAGFSGLVYGYDRVRTNALSPSYRARLPENTICGIMPSWDNTARRGLNAHVAYGANPAQFNHWLEDLRKSTLTESYNQELFINAWNEWAEKAMLEPTHVFGGLNLQVLKNHLVAASETRKLEQKI